LNNPIIFAAEIIGTIAFASSGAMIGIKKNLDVFGITVLGLCVAVGGGILRDIILGRIPPGAFENPVYAVVALATSLLLFLLVYCKQEILNSRYMWIYEKIMTYCDAVGLGIFTTVGVYTGYEAGYRGEFFLVFLGVLTGIGGGMIRDVLADTMPFVLYKHVYAVAAMAGAVVCVAFIEEHLYIAMTSGSLIILLIRILAGKYQWHLPKPMRNGKVLQNESKDDIL